MWPLNQASSNRKLPSYHFSLTAQDTCLPEKREKSLNDLEINELPKKKKEKKEKGICWGKEKNTNLGGHLRGQESIVYFCPTVHGLEH